MNLLYNSNYRKQDWINYLQQRNHDLKHWFFRINKIEGYLNHQKMTFIYG